MLAAPAAPRLVAASAPFKCALQLLLKVVALQLHVVVLLSQRALGHSMLLNLRFERHHFGAQATAKQVCCRGIVSSPLLLRLAQIPQHADLFYETPCNRRARHHEYLSMPILSM